MDDKNLLEDILLKDEILDRDELDYKKEEIFKIIPELRDMDGFDHKHPHHSYDVWRHTLVALETSEKDLTIRLALLLHDIGKPHSCQEDGNIRHFHHHPEKSYEMSKDILSRLGYSGKQLDDICYLIRYHDTIIDIDKVDLSNIELIRKQLKVQYSDAKAHNPKYVDKRIKKLDEISKDIEDKIKRLETEKDIDINTDEIEI